MNRLKKGQMGYLRSQRRVLTVRTAVLFGLSLAVYLLGIWSVGSNKNLLTIVAVLGCLPASRSAVNAVMYYRYRGIGAEDAGQIAPHESGLCTLYDLVFTSYDKNFEIHHMTVSGKSLSGYSASPACDLKACEKHLRSMCAQNGIRDVDIRLFHELPKYLNRLEALRTSGATEKEMHPQTGKGVQDGRHSRPRSEMQTPNGHDTAAQPEGTQEAAPDPQAQLVSLLCAISL